MNIINRVGGGKKLLVSMATLGAGGAERVLSILSKTLADDFEEVYYVLWDGGEVFYEIDDRIKIVKLPELSGKSGRKHQIWTFRHYVKKLKPDLVLSFLTPYNMLVLLATMGLKQKVVVAERTDPKRLLSGGRLMLKVRDWLYGYAKGILTQTEYAKSCYSGRLNSKTSVIYNPVTMSEDYVGAALRCKKEKVMVTAGRLEQVKDHQMMIEAFSLFHQTHPDYRLVIYGDGPLREQLQEQIGSYNLDDFVELPGNSNLLWDKMKVAEGFLLSSQYEGMSNAMIEAMCLGLPVISTKVAGATDLINDSKNGYLVEVGDAQAMSSKMSLLVDNEDIREQMGKEATAIFNRLKEDIICNAWVDYLKKTIES